MRIHTAISLLPGALVFFACGLHFALSVSLFQAASSFYSASWNSHFIFLGFFLGVLIGAVLGVFLVNRIGRKKNLYIAGCFTCLAGIFFFLPSQECYIVARILIGAAFGITFLTKTIYISEIADVFNRGKYLVCISFSVYLGMFLCSFIGLYYIQTVIASICMSFGVLSVVSAYFIKESPYFLIIKGEETEAMNSLAYFNRASVISHSVGSDLEDIKSQIRVEYSEQRLSLIDNVIQNNKRPFLLSVLLKLVQAVTFSPATILLNMHALVNVDYVFLVLLTARICGTIICMFLVDSRGRRICFLVSGIGATISLVLAFGLGFVDDSIEPIKYVRFVLTLAVEIFLGVGLGSVPDVFLSESLTNHTKPLANAIVLVIMVIINVLCYYVFTLAGFYNYFSFIIVYVVAIIATFIGTIAVFFFFRETKNKSLREVRDLYRR